MFKKLLTIIFVLLFFLIPSSVLANDLEITCFSEQSPEILRNTDPLFQISGFLPGDSASRTIFVENTSNYDCRIYFDVSGTSNLLTDKINVYIPTLFNNSLSEYMESNILMADLESGEDITRTITMSLPTDAGDTYQNRQASFDIEVVSEWGSDTEEGVVAGIADERKEDVGEVLGVSVLAQTGQAIILVVLFSLLVFVGYLIFKKVRKKEN